MSTTEKAVTDASKKVTKKPTTKKGKNEEASEEVMFGNNNNLEMVNFGGNDDNNLGEEFGEKQRELNFIRKWHYPHSDSLCYRFALSTANCQKVSDYHLGPTRWPWLQEDSESLQEGKIIH